MKHNLLVVIDMQHDFIDGTLGTKEAITIVPKVISKIKENKGPVIFTKDTHGTNYMDTQEGRNLPIPHTQKGMEGWQFPAEIEQLVRDNGYPVLEKGAFGSLQLGELAKEICKKEKITSIEVVGLVTDICVISNAMLLKAFLPEVEIMVDSSCCAGVTVESHNTALAAMKACQIHII